jgi:hypothetical protein
MSPIVYRIRPWAGGFAVYADDAIANEDPFPAAADAVAHAKELARGTPGGAQVVVHAEDGSVLSEFFYEPEERDALDRDDSTRSIAASRPARRHDAGRR